KLDKIGAEGVAKELATRGVADEAGVKLLRFFDGVASLDKAAALVADGDAETEVGALNAAVLGRLVEFVGDNETGARGCEELRQILSYAEALGAGRFIRIDPSLARGLAYYTGAIMEANVPDLSGSLGGGGRYDNLVGMFAGRDIPACGFSLGLERIVVVMSERGMFPSELTGANADVLVTVWDEQSIEISLALARELREAGLRVELYPEADKVGKQFKYASARSIPFVVVAGPDERARGEVALKDMRTGEQQNLKASDAARVVREGLDAARK
ncbi:MAG TPA: ATP phosphoribosyltransferase regulatory subunit, partial [Pyrinomonadaceae bacterium]|nr:ATP phosphoribosyltransferase regulatory subunit [Pyrinomonadaceae bacterium]